MTSLLDADQLKTFVAIVDSGSFTRAGDAVHKTQSAVSMQMKKLEERLGKPVFEREGRGSKLTEEGERLLDYARRIIKLNVEALASFVEAELAESDVVVRGVYDVSGSAWACRTTTPTATFPRSWRASPNPIRAWR